MSKNLKFQMKNDLSNISKVWPKKLPKGVIHSDLFIDNIFFFKRNLFSERITKILTEYFEVFVFLFLMFLRFLGFLGSYG